MAIGRNPLCNIAATIVSSVFLAIVIIFAQVIVGAVMQGLSYTSFPGRVRDIAPGLLFVVSGSFIYGLAPNRLFIHSNVTGTRGIWELITSSALNLIFYSLWVASTASIWMAIAWMLPFTEWLFKWTIG